MAVKLLRFAFCEYGEAFETESLVQRRQCTADVFGLSLEH